MYTITTTPGFILSARPYSEAGKMFSIFTRDLGLVLVAAQGIRLEKSKLRYHTQEYSFGTFSVVRGKEFWRLTNADSDEHEIDMVLVRMATLLKRLLQGEEPHPELFDCLEATSRMSKTISTERLPELESLTALRILNLLGYIGNNEVIRPFIQSLDITEELLTQLAPLRLKVNGIINVALQASHL